jgi:hypothetical protein
MLIRTGKRLREKQNPDQYHKNPREVMRDRSVQKEIYE